MKIFLCPAWQILKIRNIFPPWEQIKTFPIQQSFEKSLHSANCQRCVKATLTLLLIYFRGIIRVIMKIEMREIKFSWGVIAWDFLLIFYFIKIESKWLGKVSFRAKNQKDLLDDGKQVVCEETKNHLNRYTLFILMVHRWLLGNSHIKRYFLCYWKGPEWN